MSTRRGMSMIVALASAGLVASSGAFAVSACSSSTVGSDVGGGDAAAEARAVVEAGAEPDSSTKPTPEQCEANCKAAHPGAAPKLAAIDTCWAANCKPSCVDDTGGFDAGADADAAVDAGDLLCGTEYSSGDDTCDQCTAALCCPSWGGCFSDPDCTAYDTCIGDCQP